MNSLDPLNKNLQSCNNKLKEQEKIKKEIENDFNEIEKTIKQATNELNSKNNPSMQVSHSIPKFNQRSDIHFKNLLPKIKKIDDELTKIVQDHENTQVVSMNQFADTKYFYFSLKNKLENV